VYESCYFEEEYQEDEKEECYYGQSECHNPKCRDLSSCLECWVLDPPAWTDKKNREITRKYIESYQTPYEMIDDTVYIDPRTFPSDYNLFTMIIMLRGFQIKWPIPKGVVIEET